MCELTKLNQDISALKSAPFPMKAAAAEKVLASAYDVIESQAAQINVMRSHLDALQRKVNSYE